MTHDTSTIAICIGCRCDDLHACVSTVSKHPCSWLRVDRNIGRGVCSECPGAVNAWDSGEREFVVLETNPEADLDELAFHTYELHTRPNGRIAGIVRTNDNLDKGVPSEFAEWTVEFAGREEMVRRTGLSHIGCNGSIVVVTLDGQRLD